MKKIIYLILGMILLIGNVSAGTFINPLDLKTLLVDFFLGSMQLFVFGFIIVFSMVCARFGMNNRLYLILLVVSLILISTIPNMGINSIYLLVVSIVGLIVFRGIAKIFQ